ncbi:MAG: hypothetical protein EOP35_17870 [Rubrivivax sp.]|nr:MAG: hypothetical protein EOP35_17870 [Rubrivivax sp.]
MTGSSFAAAHVTGLLALVRELDVRGVQAASAVLVTAGQGRIDGCATLARHVGTRQVACAALGQTAD